MLKRLSHLCVPETGTKERETNEGAYYASCASGIPTSWPYRYHHQASLNMQSKQSKHSSFRQTTRSFFSASSDNHSLPGMSYLGRTMVSITDSLIRRRQCHLVLNSAGRRARRYCDRCDQNVPGGSPGGERFCDQDPIYRPSRWSLTSSAHHARGKSFP
jgi:hypothetical protein